MHFLATQMLPGHKDTGNSFSCYCKIIQMRKRQYQDSRWENTPIQVQRDGRFDKMMCPAGIIKEFYPSGFLALQMLASRMATVAQPLFFAHPWFLMMVLTTAQNKWVYSLTQAIFSSPLQSTVTTQVPFSTMWQFNICYKTKWGRDSNCAGF